MNLKQSIEQGVEIVEVVEVQAHMKFQMNEEPIEDTEDFQEALYLYDTSQVEETFPDVEPTYDVSYRGQALLVGCNIAELEDFIHRLIIKSNCKTLKISRQRYKHYMND